MKLQQSSAFRGATEWFDETAPRVRSPHCCSRIEALVTSVPLLAMKFAWLMLPLAAAFAPSTTTPRSSSALSLVPDQASQLVAAASSTHYDKPPTKRALSQAARAFVNRVFHMPSATQHADDEEGDDVVLYPLIGFTYVKDSPTHSRALPNVSCASCRLPANRDEPVFGWFSTACKVNPFDEDDGCRMPLSA